VRSASSNKFSVVLRTFQNILTHFCRLFRSCISRLPYVPKYLAWTTTALGSKDSNCFNQIVKLFMFPTRVSPCVFNITLNNISVPSKPAFCGIKNSLFYSKTLSASPYDWSSTGNYFVTIHLRALLQIKLRIFARTLIKSQNFQFL